MLHSSSSSADIPGEFIWRRLHSLTGVFLVLFLCEHLLTNSQAALLIGDDGNGFVRAVGFIHSLPYLPVIEILLLAAPILIHAAWGVRYLLTAKPNSWPGGKGSQPTLPEYTRNHAYTWQRLTSWLLLFGIAWHVWEMRFEHYPSEALYQGQHHYMVRLSMDDGLYTVADRLDVTLYDEAQIKDLRAQAVMPSQVSDRGAQLLELQADKQREEFLSALEYKPVGEDQVIASSKKIGTAMLLTIRDTMKDPIALLLYSVFVIAASFHAFNGLWSFSIVWGLALSEQAQASMRKLVTVLMLTVIFLGLTAIWGTYWVNLYH